MAGHRPWREIRHKNMTPEKLAALEKRVQRTLARIAKREAEKQQKQKPQ